MPLGRYFLYIGSLLLALLLVAGWYLPPPDAGAVRSDIDRATIRIHSVHKWPAAVVIDTTLPTIVPPPQIAAIATTPPAPATAHAARDALALASEAETKAAEPVKPAKRHVRRTRIARQPADHFAGSEMPSFRNTWFAGW